MRQQVGGHERAVAVAADGDPAAVGDAQRDDRVHGRLRARHELLDVGVVGGMPLPDDRHGRPVQDRVALGQQQQVRRAAQGGEAVGRPAHLARRGGVGVLARVGPDQHRRAVAFAMAGRQVEGGREGDPVAARVGDQALLDAAQDRRRIRVVRQGAPGAAGGVEDEVVGRLGAAFAPRQQGAAVRREDRGHRFVGPGLGAEEPLGGEGPQIEPVEERPLAVRRRAGAGQVDGVAVLQDRCARHAAAGTAQRDAGVAVDVLGAAVEQPARVAPARIEQRRAGPARLAVRLGDERRAVPGPGDAGKPVLGAGQLARRAVERRVEREQDVPPGRIHPRVAAVLRLAPDQRGRRGRVPAVAARTGGDAADRHGVGQRPVRHGDRAAAARPDLDGAGEAVRRQEPRERPPDALDEQMPAVRRAGDAGVQSRLADGGARAGGQGHRRDLAREVVLEQRLVVRVAQQVLVGPHRGRSAVVLLRVRPGRPPRRGRRRPARRHPEAAQDPAAVRQPLARIAPDGVQRRARQRTRPAGRQVDDPQLDPGVPEDGVGEMRTVRREARPAERRAAGRGHPHFAAARRAAGGVEADDGQRGDFGRAPRPAVARVDPVAGQPVQRPGQPADRRHAPPLDEHRDVAGRPHDHGRGRRRVENVDDGPGRGEVAGLVRGVRLRPGRSGDAEQNERQRDAGDACHGSLR